MLERFKQHKKAVIIGTCVLVAGSALAWVAWGRSPAAPVQVFASVKRGDLVVTVTGSGQTSVSSQVEVKAKASGDITKVAVENGQEVKAGALLASINGKDAEKSVRNAQTSLQSAQLALEKLKQPADSYDFLQSRNALESAKGSLEKLKQSQKDDYDRALETKRKAQDSQNKAYEDGLNAIAGAFLDLPVIITDLDSMMHGEDLSRSEPAIGGGQKNNAALLNATPPEYRDALDPLQTTAENDYNTARLKYDSSFTHFRAVDRYAEQSAIESLLKETLTATKAMAQAAKSQNNYLDAWVDYRTRKHSTVFAGVQTYRDTLSAHIGKVNSHLSTLLQIDQDLKDSRDAILNADRDLKQMETDQPLDLAAAEALVKERAAALDQLQKGADPLDIRSQELTVRQRQNELQDAQAAWADYSIRAPFDGIVAKVNFKKGDSIGSGTAFATVIAKQQTAQITLNEVDAAKIKVGQKAALTFDALPDLSISGVVGEIDTLGTVSQGVVTYSVLIALDTQDGRVKTGMTVSASIVTESHANTLVVPAAAVKTERGKSYVETATGRVSVEVGLTNDTSVEILSGLSEGDRIVVRTIQPAGASATTQAPSLFGTGGNRTGGSGAAGSFRNLR